MVVILLQVVVEAVEAVEHPMAMGEHLMEEGREGEEEARGCSIHHSKFQK